MAKTRVAIVKSPPQPGEKEIEATVRKAIELSGGLGGIVKRGDSVIIKPNVVGPRPEGHPAVTDWRVCKAIANMVKEVGARPIIGEASPVGIKTEDCFQPSGYAKLRSQGYEVMDLKAEGLEMVKVPIPKGRNMKEITLPRIVLESVIIDVPKMKTHDQPLVTLAIKNMKGVMPDVFKRKFHTTFGIFQGCADLALAVKPKLAVVDGIIAMEGLGPIFGDPVEMDLIIAGRDMVAVDAVTCSVMGIEPKEDGCVRVAAECGIGVADLRKIEVVGEPIAKVKRRFKRSVEAISERVPFPEGFRLLFSDKVCTGCRNCVMSVLLDLQDTHLLEKAKGWTVIAGKPDKIPTDVSKERLLLVGVCTARYKDRGVYVEGCTPNNRDIASALVGEEQKPNW